MTWKNRRQASVRRAPPWRSSSAATRAAPASVTPAAAGERTLAGTGRAETGEPALAATGGAERRRASAPSPAPASGDRPLDSGLGSTAGRCVRRRRGRQGLASGVRTPEEGYRCQQREFTQRGTATAHRPLRRPVEVMRRSAGSATRRTRAHRPLRRPVDATSCVYLGGNGGHEPRYAEEAGHPRTPDGGRGRRPGVRRRPGRPDGRPGRRRPGGRRLRHRRRSAATLVPGASPTRGSAGSTKSTRCTNAST